MSSRKRWWQMTRKRSRATSIAFSMVDELFHPQASHAKLIIEEQRIEAVDLSGSADPLKKITIKRSNKTED